MSVKGMQCVLIVISLLLAGCSRDEPRPQKEVSQDSKPATQAKSEPNNSAGRQASPTPAKETTTVSVPVSQPPEPVAVVPQAEPPEEPKHPDVVFVPTPPEVVAKMLELAKVTKDDVVYDLGCGDGRIVVAAAKLGCKAYGFDVDPQRIKESNENVEQSGVGDLATIVQKDIFTLDLSGANVITLYLLPSLNVKLIPQLEKLKPGSRIVSHDFDMEGATPDQTVEVISENGTQHMVYLWTTPLRKEPATSTQ
ncbi:MAG: methyltransferase domain-containing protein [Sedimentisphaerales bacterium]|nr:methyltransferase domain-containing protein [Sedimentisphaerales bacterium]